MRSIANQLAASISSGHASSTGLQTYRNEETLMPTGHLEHALLHFPLRAHRATAWTIVKTNHKFGRLNIKTTPTHCSVNRRVKATQTI
jgi:hypothetical protein